MPRPCKPANPFRYFNSSPEVIRLVVMMYVRYPLSLRNVEDLLFERGIDICHETALPCPNPAERREVAIGLTAPRVALCRPTLQPHLPAAASTLPLLKAVSLISEHGRSGYQFSWF
jgi:hypothetical protein